MAEPRLKHFVLVRWLPLNMNLTFANAVLLNIFLMLCK
jgi:hypothetical protein